MADLPDPGHISDDARTQVEMQTDFEKLRDQLAQRVGYGDPDSLSLSGGSITPAVAKILVQSETAPADYEDEIQTIVTTNMPDGQVVRVMPDTGAIITFEMGGNFLLSGYEDVVLTEFDSIYMMLFSGTWFPIALYRDDVVDARADLGLGNAALANEATLDADTFDTLHATDLADGTAGVADDADLLVGLSAAELARVDNGPGEQVMAGALRTSAAWLRVQSPASSPVVELKDDLGQVRTFLQHDGVNFDWSLLDDVGTAVNGLRVRQDDIPQWWNTGKSGGPGWEDLWGDSLGDQPEITIKRHRVTWSGYRDPQAAVYESLTPFEPAEPVEAYGHIFNFETVSMVNDGGGYVRWTTGLFDMNDLAGFPPLPYTKERMTFALEGPLDVEFAGTITITLDLLYWLDIRS